ncbi:MFS transporter [Membranihabitans marinus]|uniref:MFS transporter n=1 Tax=Membranihabitans marinus TaxID=1227546 RepID=UPI001F39C944|nr:MFS transporter [Membranihabitans marinus]
MEDGKINSAIDSKYDNYTVMQHMLRLPVLVAALGYLVDMYDLFLFSIVRVPSLTDLGLTGDQLLEDGVMLLNLQMAGLLIGGIFWGILGDKKGRLSVLFGSILIYSLANIANGFVTSFNQYAVLRFIAGVGLAGELGAGITLVSEILPKKIRGYGTTLVATLGVLGAILAYVVAELFAWRASYSIGGVMGLVLLVMRFRVFESGMFMESKEKKVDRGNVMLLFNNRARFFKYLKSIVIGFPIWFVVGVLITFSPELGAAIGLDEPVDAGIAVMLSFAFQALGNVVSGILSQRYQSRKKIIGAFIVLSFVFAVIYLWLPSTSVFVFYLLCALLGFANGYWTLFITVAAELFGTNIRATVATTVPNFVRGAVIPITTMFLFLKTGMGVINSALIVGAITTILALLALWTLPETFHKDLNYNEEN